MTRTRRQDLLVPDVCRWHGQHVTAFDRGSSDLVRSDRQDRPGPVAIGRVSLWQVIKSRWGDRLVGSTRRALRGTVEASTVAILATGTGTDIATADIERLDATVRVRTSPSVRRVRATVRSEGVLTSGMMLMGGSSNFRYHQVGLRIAGSEGSARKWQERTPAMAAGLTNHRRTTQNMSDCAIHLPAWVAPRRRDRPPRRLPAA